MTAHDKICNSVQENFKTLVTIFEFMLTILKLSIKRFLLQFYSVNLVKPYIRQIVHGLGKSLIAFGSVEIYGTEECLVLV